MICFEQGLHIAEKCGYKKLMVMLLCNIGFAYKKMNESRTSIKFYEKSLRISIDI